MIEERNDMVRFVKIILADLFCLIVDESNVVSGTLAKFDAWFWLKCSLHVCLRWESIWPQMLFWYVADRATNEFIRSKIYVILIPKIQSPKLPHYSLLFFCLKKISLFRLWYDGDITREELGCCSQIVSSFTPDSTL